MGGSALPGMLEENVSRWGGTIAWSSFSSYFLSRTAVVFSEPGRAVNEQFIYWGRCCCGSAIMSFFKWFWLAIAILVYALILWRAFHV